MAGRLPRGPNENRGKGDRWNREGLDGNYTEHDDSSETSAHKYPGKVMPVTHKKGADADGTEATAPFTRGHRSRG